MFKARKEYRKKFSAAGQIYIGGEVLALICQDISVQGAMVKVKPGQFLSSIEDFNNLLYDECQAEIFIDDLTIASDVKVVWAKEQTGQIQLGVEFLTIQSNSPKLWRKRRSYRKIKPFSAELVIDKNKLSVDGVNCSLEGACLKTARHHPSIKVDNLIKLQIRQYGIQAVGRVVWVAQDKDAIIFGLNMLPV